MSWVSGQGRGNGVFGKILVENARGGGICISRGYTVVGQSMVAREWLGGLEGVGVFVHLCICAFVSFVHLCRLRICAFVHLCRLCFWHCAFSAFGTCLWIAIAIGIGVNHELYY